MARGVVLDLDHHFVNDFIDDTGIGQYLADDRGEEGAAPLVKFLECGFVAVPNRFEQPFLQCQTLGEAFLRFPVVFGFHKLVGNPFSKQGAMSLYRVKGLNSVKKMYEKKTGK